jgi:hypothetical protein
LWASPAAAAWCDSDVPGLTRLVVLETIEEPDARVLAETRQLEDRYLLSPWARRVAKAELDEPAAESATSSRSGRSRSGALRVIKGGDGAA